jgi:cell division protein FtsQ
MTFWGKSAKHASRRSARLWAQRLKRLAIFVVAGCGIVALTCYCIKTQAISRMAAYGYDKMLTTSAVAGFRVDEILVTGRQRIPASALLAQLDIDNGTPIFNVSVAEAQARVANIPWVDSVAVSRRLPAKIFVHITERSPIALWQHQKKLALVDATGAVLTAEGLEGYKDLPLVVGEDAAQHAAQLIRLLQAEPEICSRLVSAQRVGARRWDLRLKNNVLIRLPEKNVGYALRRAAVQQEKNALFDKPVVTIDLRLPDRLVVKTGHKKEEASTSDKKST